MHKKPEACSNIPRRQVLKALTTLLAAACLPVNFAVSARTDDLFDETMRALLAALARTLFPHAFLTEQQLLRGVSALADRAAGDAELLAQVHALLEGLPANFATLDQARREAALRRSPNGAALLALRGAAVSTIYQDPAVWKAIGYPGPSAPFGGYTGPELADIDWLAEDEV